MYKRQNLERLLFALTQDTQEVKQYMEQLNASGRYEVRKPILERLQKLFQGYCCDDRETQRVIGEVYRQHDYLIDPHTAVAFSALDQYRKESGDDTPCVVVSTASPFKFCDNVLGALEGFKDVPHTRIMVFYPRDGVSQVQELQMVTQEGNNVGVTAVRGNFDDAQSGVKRLFSDGELRRTLADREMCIRDRECTVWAAPPPVERPWSRPAWSTGWTVMLCWRRSTR